MAMLGLFTSLFPLLDIHLSWKYLSPDSILLSEDLVTTKGKQDIPCTSDTGARNSMYTLMIPSRPYLAVNVKGFYLLLYSITLRTFVPY